jgi:hypothetical protein
MKKVVLLTLILIQSSAFAAVEISGSYYYTKQEYPNIDTTADDDISVTRTYSGTIAWYLFSHTAIEVFYSTNEDINVDNDVGLDDTATGKTINTIKSTLTTDSLGIGIRQAFAGRKSAIIPTLSIGYSSQKQMTNYKYSYDDGGSGEIESGETESDVSYVTLSVRIRLTQALGLKGSITGTYDDLDFSESPQQLKYTAGLSWMF